MSRAKSPFLLLEEFGTGRTLRFGDPVRLLRADTLGEVDAVLAQMQDAHLAGFHLAGYAAYEAGYAFEPRLRRLFRPAGGPLLCFGLFEEPEVFAWDDEAGEVDLGLLEPLWSRGDYQRRFDRVGEYIRAGDVYQVNLTFPMQGRWSGDPVSLYAVLRRRQQAPFGALVALGDQTLLSFSPELFFATEDRTIRVRPMKGTAARGRDPEEDDRLAEGLASGAKTRAENLMIVDLLRNDVGRIAAIGSVKVTDLFTVERYPTVLQMTSGVQARLLDGIGLPELFGSLFPCGSVTGAPKIRAMEIIRELEDTPRGAYCGSIGAIRPDGSAQFSVAIRTVVLSSDGTFVFNVGSGVVFDSDAQAEYEECLLKARFLEPASEASV